MFALANAGGVVAYAPLLTLLLPAKIAAVAGEARIEWLGAATLAGAFAASLSNLLVGWASDVAGSRRTWATAGLCLTLASYALLHAATSPLQIVAAVAAYQVALNTLLAPLAAWAADEVPDRRKGLLGGLIGAGQPAGALAGVAATLPGLTTEAARLGLVCAIALALIVPLLSTTPRPKASSGEFAPGRVTARRDFALLWLARLLVQVAGGVLFGFLLYYFQTLPDAPSDSDVARLSAVALTLALPIGLIAGRASDRLDRRKPFLLVAVAVVALSLVLMAATTGQCSSAIGYALFSCGSAVFLALHSSYAMQLLPTPGRHGRDLGLLNLANTLPAVIAPLLAISLVPGRGFGPLLLVLATLILIAGVCVLLVSRDAQGA